MFIVSEVPLYIVGVLVVSAGSISLTMFLKEAWGKVQEMGLQDAVDGMFRDEE